jgi:hypothetical protein
MVEIDKGQKPLVQIIGFWCQIEVGIDIRDVYWVGNRYLLLLNKISMLWRIIRLKRMNK